MWNSVIDHVTGRTHDYGFYLFSCSKCGHVFARPATDPRLWPSGEVAEVRWVNPRAACPKCKKSVESCDDLWCPDPQEEMKRRADEWASRQKPRVMGMPLVSYAVFPEGIVRLHLRRCELHGRDPEGQMKITDYTAFDDQGRRYRAVLGMAVRDDGAMGQYAPDEKSAAFFSTQYTEAVEAFEDPEWKAQVPDYERVTEEQLRGEK